jgi:SAM-dependent methyltransferase
MKAELAQNTYRGLHAAHYDLIYGAKPYRHEAEFVDRLLREHASRPGRLVDLACGTGRHAREFAAMGWEVTGVDYSEDLLAAARANAPEVRFHCRDIRTLDLGDDRFDAVTCLFDSIGYPLTDEGIVATLERADAHLRPQGTVVVEFLHAAAVLRHASPTRVRHWSLPDGGELVRTSQVELDRGSDVMRVSYELLEHGPDGTPRARASDELATRFFTLEGMRALMQAAGLRVVEYAPAYVDRGSIDDTVWHVLAAAKAKSAGA